ncbi:MAG: pilin [Oscillospiraceae bacterium]|nr:pilin [Oscillospiraceae bacterium]
MKIVKRTFLMLILMITVTLVTNTTVYAEPQGMPGIPGVPGPGGDIQQWVVTPDPSITLQVETETFNHQPTVEDAGPLLVIGGRILGIVRNIAIVVCILMISVLGVKYIVGSLEEKAKYKETMIPLIIGAGVVVFSVVIAEAIFNMMT